MSVRIAVVGAGPGGLSAARRLAVEPGVEVLLVAPEGVARHHAGTLPVLLGADPDDFTFPISLAGVSVIAESATGLRPGEVVLGASSLAVDAVVVATGLELDLAAVPRGPGVAAAWDLQTAAQAAPILAGEGGRTVIAVSSLPYRCPPAPFSLAMRLARAGRQVTVLTPEEQPLAGVGGAAPGALQAAAEEAGVETRCGFELDLGEGLEGVAVSRDGTRADFARALVIPPHRAPRFLADLDGGPLVPVGAHGATRMPGVFAAGDVVAGALPRAAGVAEAQGLTAAEGALAFLEICPPQEPAVPAPECALDHGDGRFSRIAISFPGGLPPEGSRRVEVDGPSRQLAGLPQAAAARLRSLAGGPGREGDREGGSRQIPEEGR